MNYETQLTCADPRPPVTDLLMKLSRTMSMSSLTWPILPHILAWMEGYISTSSIVSVINLSRMWATYNEQSKYIECPWLDVNEKRMIQEMTLIYLQLFRFVNGRFAESRQVRKPRRHVLETQMFQLNRRGSETLRWENVSILDIRSVFLNRCAVNFF